MAAATADLESRTPSVAGDDHQSLLLPVGGTLTTALHRLEAFLSLLGFHHSASRISFVLSASAFVVLGIATPIVSVYFSRCPGSRCALYQIERFEIWDFVFEMALAAVSLACVSRNLVKYGMRRFLFVDQHHGEVDRFQKEYTRKIQVPVVPGLLHCDIASSMLLNTTDVCCIESDEGRFPAMEVQREHAFFILLLWWILPCFFVKTVREIIRFGYAHHDSMWKSIVVLLASTVSWTYLTTIFLAACALFNLVCNLQVIHFDDYNKLLERDTDPLVYLEEHMHLRYYLSKISHRFRICLLSLFLFVTTSQFVMLFQTTGYGEQVNFINAGNLAVSSVVQVVGIVLCLTAAAKISHRAQGIASVASRWHALVTCAPSDSSQPRVTRTNGSENSDVVLANALVREVSESDLESIDNVAVQVNTQLVSCMSSYHKRQALVMYLQSNPGGITIFGWTVDRALINTIFFLELTLVLFVLGKTIVFSAH